jgi:hypothetical protein
MPSCEADAEPMKIFLLAIAFSLVVIDGAALVSMLLAH